MIFAWTPQAHGASGFLKEGNQNIKKELFLMHLFVPFKLYTVPLYCQVKSNPEMQIHVLILYPLEM